MNHQPFRSTLPALTSSFPDKRLADKSFSVSLNNFFWSINNYDASLAESIRA